MAWNESICIQTMVSPICYHGQGKLVTLHSVLIDRKVKPFYVIRASHSDFDVWCVKCHITAINISNLSWTSEFLDVTRAAYKHITVPPVS